MSDRERELRHLEELADLMDSKFVLPGTSIRFGLDSLLGLIPGVGDTIGLITSVYIAGRAQAHDVPAHIKWVMLWNIFIDWLIGLIPLIGDIFDIGFKANRKNIELIRKHSGSPHAKIIDAEIIDG